MKLINLAALIAVSVVVAPAWAVVSTSYVAPASPQSEGFTAIPFGPASQTTALANDLGQPAWSIAGTATASQFGYASGTFSADQLSAIASNGFTLSLDARGLRGLSLPFDTTNHIIVMGAEVEFGTKRFEIDLGLDANGDTVVSLPTTLDAAGPGSAVRSFGASYTLAGEGNGYHLYKLQYDPIVQRATLLVDGTPRLFDYAGNNSFAGNRGLVWFAASGGIGNFNTVQVAVPELTTSAMLLVGTLALIALRRRDSADTPNRDA